MKTIVIMRSTDYLNHFRDETKREFVPLVRTAHLLDEGSPRRETYLHSRKHNWLYSFTEEIADTTKESPNLFLLDWNIAQEAIVVRAFYTKGKTFKVDAKGRPVASERRIEDWDSREFASTDEHLFAPVAKKDAPQLVMIKKLENGKTLITIDGIFTYTFDKRKRCIEIVKKLQDGKPHKMENPKRYFQHNEKTIQRVKKSPHNSETKETTITQEGDYHKFSENHLTSDGKGYWRIVSHN